MMRFYKHGLLILMQWYFNLTAEYHLTRVTTLGLTSLSALKLGNYYPDRLGKKNMNSS